MNLWSANWSANARCQSSIPGPCCITITSGAFPAPVGYSAYVCKLTLSTGRFIEFLAKS